MYYSFRDISSESCGEGSEDRDANKNRDEISYHEASNELLEDYRILFMIFVPTTNYEPLE